MYSCYTDLRFVQNITTNWKSTEQLEHKQLDIISRWVELIKNKARVKTALILDSLTWIKAEMECMHACIAYIPRLQWVNGNNVENGRYNNYSTRNNIACYHHAASDYVNGSLL